MRIYRRREVAVGAVPVAFHGVFSHPQASAIAGAAEPLVLARPTLNVQALADRVLVQRYSPVGILCNEKGDILYISGRSGKYLEPVAGKADWNVTAMAREGLRYPLSTAFASARRAERPFSVRAVKVSTDGGSEIVDITVEKLTEPEALRGTFMVVIAEVSARPGVVLLPTARPTARGRRLEELEKELRHTREETQIVREEMQTSRGRSSSRPTRSCTDRRGAAEHQRGAARVDQRGAAEQHQRRTQGPRRRRCSR